VRIINARQKPLSLLLLGQVQEKFDDVRAVAVQMLFQIVD